MCTGKRAVLQEESNCERAGGRKRKDLDRSNGKRTKCGRKETKTGREERMRREREREREGGRADGSSPHSEAASRPEGAAFLRAPCSISCL